MQYQPTQTRRSVRRSKWKARCLGRQIDMLPGEFFAGAATLLAARMAALREQIEARRFILFRLSFTFRCGGEINILRDYPPGHAPRRQIAETPKAVDVDLNLTHNRMGFHTLFSAKRRYEAPQTQIGPTGTFRTDAPSPNSGWQKASLRDLRQNHPACVRPAVRCQPLPDAGCSRRPVAQCAGPPPSTGLP